MMRHTRLKHQFVHHIPEHLEPGILYVSVDYATAVHSCCCGCGQEVVTPLSPAGWKLTFDGETVSLSPSIGNRYFECRSHYFIERNQIIEARPWTSEWDEQEGIDDNTKAVIGGDDKTRDGALGAWSRIKGWMAKRKRVAKANRTADQAGAANGVPKRKPSKGRPEKEDRSDQR